MAEEETGDLLDSEVTPEKTEEAPEQKENQPQEVDKKGEQSPDDVPTGDLLSDDEDAGENASETSYEFEVPEELADVPYNEEALEAFKETAKELGLSQEQFQALAEFDLRNAQKAEEAAVSAWHDRVNGWKQSSLADPDIGGKNFAETKVNVKAAIDAFADKEAKALLSSPTEDNPDGLALQNHPAFLRMMNRIGKALGDPDFHGGEEAAPAGDALKRMYPSMYSSEEA